MENPPSFSFGDTSTVMQQEGLALVLVGIDSRYGLRRDRRGIGNYIYNLLIKFQELRPQGMQFVLYADKTAAPEIVKMFQGDPFLVRVLPSANPIWWEQVLLPLAARRDGIDLLHCTSNMAPVFSMSYRLVTTIHDVIELRRREFGDINLQFRQWLMRVYRNGLLPKVARRSDLLITDTKFSRQDIVTMLGIASGRVRVVYMAASRKAGMNGSGGKTRIEELGIGGRYIFALGAVDGRKNTARLLEAYRMLRKATATDVSLVVAGIERPGEFASLSGGGVVLCGFLPDEMIATLYRHSLFFIYPSLYEGFGLPVLEAMDLGVPVLCSATTAVGEIAGDAALKFEPQDSADMAAKMKLLLEDDILRDKLAEKSRIRARGFSWERCAQETISVYYEVLSDKGQ